MKKGEKKEDTRGIDNKSTCLPSAAHAIASIGIESDKIIQDFFASHSDSPLFKIDHQDLLTILAESFKTGQWIDVEAAKVLKEYLEEIKKGHKIDIIALSRWVLSHPNDARAVLECMSIVPPPEIDIIRVLSRAGSQKLVFLATWRLTQRQVVLKKLTGPPDVVNKIIARELQSHPLAMRHDNIIKTHFLKNDYGELFLVENRLPFLLHDNWNSEGVYEAANLFYDIAKAVKFLHEQDLVHGDIKPDNIGKDGEDYILLDFGICRLKKDFASDATATGSLRTRAPELLERDKYPEQPEKVDIWALGATVYNALVGRFPLFDKGETPPRVSKNEERSQFESILLDRVTKEWNKRVDLSLVPEPMRNLLLKALESDPKIRSSASELIKIAEDQLSAFLRKPSPIGKFSPLEILNQLKNYLPNNPEILKLMPSTQKDALRKKLEDLKSTKGFNKDQKEKIESLFKKLVYA
ncbi:MAG: protein kinase [Methanobacteriaceae archaeon]|nr:protein kinase [Methanobacteriaceae archaeon]